MFAPKQPGAMPLFAASGPTQSLIGHIRVDHSLFSFDLSVVSSDYLYACLER